MTYELSTQPVSCFVEEAAKSSYLKIDKTDLTYTKVKTADFAPKGSDIDIDYDEEHRQNQEYWSAVRYAKNQLYDYYGVACHFFPDAQENLMRINNMAPDEILNEACKNGLI